MTPRLDKIGAHMIVRALTMCIVCACFAVETQAATAAPIIVGGGFDYVERAGQRTRSALAVIGAPLGTNVSATVAGIRYDDASVGTGTGVLAGLALGVTPGARLRGWGTQYFGDQDFRAWRVKGGPEATLPAGGTLGVFYAHDESNLGQVSNAGIAELVVPIVRTVSGRASGSYASTRDGSASAYGSLGLGWAPVRNLEVTGDIGIASSGAAATSSTSPRSGLPLLGGRGVPATPSSSGSSSEIPAEAVFQLGVRLMFP